jgi:beta-N-acetylhexosaminidase
MSVSAAIFGCSAPTITSGEAAFFRDCNPWGFILFARNVETPDQVRRLCADLRESVGRDAPIFVDQEGGRVQRLSPPHWRKAPWGGIFGELYEKDAVSACRAVWLNFRLIADELRQVGITANCAPVLDLPVFGADPIISDRAFSPKPEWMNAMADACMAGLTAGGVAPVIKHLPGHGRAKVDSHKALPIIETPISEMQDYDFLPFIHCQDAPMAMTAHLILKNIDPFTPVTLSKKVITEIIRGRLGFDGLLMSDDLNMKALEGSLENLTERSLAAGCDVVLQCNGKMPDMVNVAKGLRALDAVGKRRAHVTELMCEHQEMFDRTAALEEYEALMAQIEKTD